MPDLSLYDWMDRIGLKNYRLKIMLMAFVGTHIPLIVLISYFASKSSADWSALFATIGVTLIATLVGTGITLVVLAHLLKPVVIVSRALRSYRQSRLISALPSHYTDEVGTLMADTSETLQHLERVRDVLETVDASTGLPNRGKLVRDMAVRRKADDRFAACVIRFTTYERLVETLDLKSAEKAAADMAARLASILPEGQTLYRISGADFVWLARADGEAPLSPESLEAHIRDVMERSAAMLSAGEVKIEPVLCGGVALYPDDASEPEAVIDHAVAAVSQASATVPVSFHSPASRLASVERLRMEQELRKALAKNEFVLHYQPVVDLSLGECVGAEALIRWQHPERGMIPPMKFIGLAEATGLIDPMGLWVMREACMQVRSWNESGLPGMKVAINLSARQFLDADLISHVDDAITASGISANQLEIELTETAAMADHAFTKRVFGKLRDLGVSIAIDDFGTGYASMSYLRKLPFDKLKIDREFVTNVHSSRDSQAICGALVTLAKGLGLRVLAEGTETPDEVRYLSGRGCDLYQGYYFSKPLASDHFRSGLAVVSDSVLALAGHNGLRRQLSLAS